jgi:outer membrane protein
MRPTAWLLALALAAGVRPALAASAPPARPAGTDTLRLTLDDAVARALREAPEARIARATATAADGQVRQALAAALPQVTGTVTYDRKFASPFQGFSGDTIFGPIFSHSSFAAVHNWTTDLTATQVLWSAGRVSSGLSAARHARTALRAQRDETLADVALSVRSAYFEAAYARQVQGIAEDALEQARAHLRQVKLMFDRGARSEYDLLQAQVDAANAEPSAVAARNGADVAMLELQRQLDLPLGQPLTLLTPLAFDASGVPVPADDGADGSGRAALASADEMVRARRELLDVNAAGKWPTLSASATVSHQAYPTEWRPSRRDFVKAIDGSLKLSWPLFEGFRTFGLVQQARADLRQAEAERDLAHQNVALQVEEARNEVRRALATLVARRGTAALAKRAHHLATVRWTNGLSTQLEVSDARLQMQTAEVNEVAAVKEYRVALLRLERATGRPVTTTTKTWDELTSEGVTP